MQKLIMSFFKLCNLKPLEIRKGVWQVPIGEVLMKELDGWRAQARLLQFTFDKNLAELYGADLICPGSYRLNSILQVIRKQGRLSQAHIPPQFFHEAGIRKKALSTFAPPKRAYVINSNLGYAQYLQLEILVEAEGLQKKESIHTVVVDLSSGKVLKFAFPHHLLQEGGVDETLIRKRKISLKKAFLNATAHLQEIISEGNLAWAHEAKKQFYLEEKKLLEFFSNNAESSAFKAKKQELTKRHMPVLRMDALRGVLLLIPLFCYQLIIVDTNAKESNRTFTYDPISNLAADLDKISGHTPNRSSPHH